MEQIYSPEDAVKRRKEINMERYTPKPETRKFITNPQGGEKEVIVRPFKEAPPAKEITGERFTKHLFIPDLHYPDYNKKIFTPVINFAKDFKPHVVHILGDWMNFTAAGKFEVIEEYSYTLKDEIEGGRELLIQTVDAIRENNLDVEIEFYEGNHEFRLKKYIAKHAAALKGLTDISGGEIYDLAFLMGLKELGIKWHNYTYLHREDGVIVEHGQIVRSKSGYTASGQLDKRGQSGFSGHSHRLAMISRNQGGDVKFWVECGSLCNQQPTPNYAVEPDWVSGFAIGIYDKEENIMHPHTVLIQKDQFYVLGFGHYK